MANTFSILGGAASGAASGSAAGVPGMAIGAGLGAINAAKGNEMTAGEMNDANQLMGMQAMWNNTQAEKTFALQKQMYDYTYNKTTPKQQVENLKAAGLNPALLYGQTGASGTQASTGSAQASGVGTPGNISSGAAKEQQRIAQQGMAMQLASLASEIKVNESIANKNNVEAEKTAGVDTDVARQSIENLIAQASTEKEKAILTKVESRLKDAESDILESNADNIIRNTEIAIDEATARIRQLTAQSEISEGTKISVIKEAQARAIGAVIENALKQSQIAVNKQNIESMAASIAQGWTGLNLKEREVSVNEFEAELKAVLPTTGQVTGRVLNATASAMMKVLKGIDKIMKTEIKGISELGDMPKLK